MIFKWGKTSLRNYEQLSPGLKRVATRVQGYGILDFSIIEAYRTRGEQNRYYDLGKTKVRWPHSKHNHLPSVAMDCAPYVAGKISWFKLHCCILAGLILAAAKEEGVKLRWGGNWDMDDEPITDQDFQDLVHFEEVD